MASKETKCVRCGKPFIEVIVATAFAGIVAAYLFATFFFNLIAAGEPGVEDFVGGIFPIGLEYIAISLIVVIIFMPIMMAGVVPALKKRHQSGYGLACSACKQVLISEAKDAVIKKQQAEEAKAYAYMAKVEGMEKNDPWLGEMIRSWKNDHPNKMPEEAMLNELSLARNMEKAGNFEKAAVILEKYEFWDEAGKVRKLDDEKVIKHITVDMNELIDQVSTKGLAIPYKCQSCGASITIDKDSKKDGLKFCSYCGTSYNIEDMTKIIQQALD
ncbi:MAG: hypothetical protein MIO90_02040 [Methanomassiliicoccales archaeon]|nr:hypothetical protein [Methanomassiliicoccales archaeon]